MGWVLAIWNGALVLGLVTKFREGFDGGASDAIICSSGQVEEDFMEWMVAEEGGREALYTVTPLEWINGVVGEYCWLAVTAPRIPQGQNFKIFYLFLKIAVLQEF